MDDWSVQPTRLVEFRVLDEKPLQVVSAIWVFGLVLLAAPLSHGSPATSQQGVGRRQAKPTTPAKAKSRPSAAHLPHGPAGSDRNVAPPSTAALSPASSSPEIDADTLAELRECQTTLVPGQAVVADSRGRPALVVGRRRVFDRTRGYVCIPSYAISPKPVTQAQYESVLGVRPHGTEFVPERPVFVSFLQAADYCNTVSIKERLTPCYEVKVDKNGKKTVAWPSRLSCTGYRLPAIEEAAAYQRGTESEWTWVSSTLPLGQLDVRNDAPRGFYLARNSAANPVGPAAGKRQAKR